MIDKKIKKLEEKLKTLKEEKNWDTCDFCGEERTDFKCWWCRRYICKKHENERIVIENMTIGGQLRSCKICNEERKKYEEILRELEGKYHKNRNELEVNFLNSRLELNPKYKGKNISWRDIAWKR